MNLELLKNGESNTMTCAQTERNKSGKRGTKRKSRRKEGNRKTERKVVGWSGERLDAGKERKMERTLRRQRIMELV